MIRLVAMSLILVLIGTSSIFAQPKASDTAWETIIARADGGVACVLVSRSDWYRKLGLAGEPDGPGRLGGFEPRVIETLDPFKIGILPQDTFREQEFRKRSLRQKLDLGDAFHAPEAFGSGIVLDQQGLVLTNYHVVQDAVKIYVRLSNGKGAYADIFAADPRSDLAVLKLLRGDLGKWTPLPLGEADELKRGQPVLALANPLAAGFLDGQPSASVGIISNLRRRIPGRQPLRETNANPLHQYGVLLQTDARVALGSSGGALLNDKGECVGITTALAALVGTDAQGGFALPLTTHLRKVIDLLKAGEEIDYGYLGVALDEFPAGGAVVASAQDGSPAQIDGHLRGGDVIATIGPFPVKDNQDLMLALGMYLAGDRVSLGVLRGGMGPEQKVNINLVKYHVPGKKIIANSPGKRPFVSGLRVDYTSIIAQKPNAFAAIPSGVLVTDVQPNSKAARAALFTDDVITHVAGQAVNTPARFYEELARHPGAIEFSVRRRGQPTIRVRW